MQVCWVIKAGSRQPASKPWAGCSKATRSAARSSERKPPRSFLLRSKATPVALMLSRRIYDIITEKEEWGGIRQEKGPAEPEPCVPGGASKARSSQAPVSLSPGKTDVSGAPRPHVAAHLTTSPTVAFPSHAGLTHTGTPKSGPRFAALGMAIPYMSSILNTICSFKFWFSLKR